MTNQQLKNNVKRMDMMDVIWAVRDKGFTVTLSGGTSACTFDVYDNERFAVRDEASLRKILLGEDKYFA